MSFIAILLASLLGSPHCIAMCGGFVGLYSAAETKSIFKDLLYHCGRLTTYLSLGALAGTIGSSVNHSALILGVQYCAQYIVGGILIVWGIKRLFSITLPSSISSKLINYLVRPLHALLQKRSLKERSFFPFFLGLTSTLLPCGWLYAYVAVAAGTGSAIVGMVTMAVFWIGTLPALLGVSFGARFILPSLHRYVPVITSLLLISAGIFSLYGHLTPMDHHHHHHHEMMP